MGVGSLPSVVETCVSQAMLPRKIGILLTQIYSRSCDATAEICSYRRAVAIYMLPATV